MTAMDFLLKWRAFDALKGGRVNVRNDAPRPRTIPDGDDTPLFESPDKGRPQLGDVIEPTPAIKRAGARAKMEADKGAEIITLDPSQAPKSIREERERADAIKMRKAPPSEEPFTPPKPPKASDVNLREGRTMFDDAPAKTEKQPTRAKSLTGPAMKGNIRKTQKAQPKLSANERELAKKLVTQRQVKTRDGKTVPVTTRLRSPWPEIFGPPTQRNKL